LENEEIGEEKSAGELRHKVVLDFVRDISEGRLYLGVDQKKWGLQDIELIGNTTGRLIRDLSEYVSGAVAGEEFEFLEKQIFFSISVLRTYDTLKTNINESRVEAELRNLQFKVESLGIKIDEAMETFNAKMPVEEKDRTAKESTFPRSIAPLQNKETKNKIEESRTPDEEEGLF
jgi:molybdopterin converting factor small subunit